MISRTSAILAKKELYIDAAKMTGAGQLRIVLYHLLPNSIDQPLTQAVGYFGTAIATESILSYLGLGVPPPQPSLGRMIQEGTRSFFEIAPWLVIFPGVTLFVMVFCFSWLAGKIQKPAGGI
jgi:ABC-type dipeptide/oligopeptide/nickel transport system permease subunit